MQLQQNVHWSLQFDDSADIPSCCLHRKEEFHSSCLNTNLVVTRHYMQLTQSRSARVTGDMHAAARNIPIRASLLSRTKQRRRAPRTHHLAFKEYEPVPRNELS
eukprot:6188653-Pleurochrysis_carterae.AAC.4